MKVHFHDRLLAMILVILLTACAPPGSSVEPTTAREEAIQPAATNVTAPTLTPTPTVTETPVPTPPVTYTPVPTPAPTRTTPPSATALPGDREGEEIAEEQLLALMMTEMLLVMLEETTTQAQQGEIDGLEAWGQLIAVLAISTAVEEALEADPPPTLEAAWLEARDAVALIRSIAIPWFDGEMDSEEVMDALDPARQSVKRVMELAGAVLAREYGVDLAEWDATREQLLEEFRQELRGENTDAQAE